MGAKRDPDATRERILRAAGDEILRSGYRSASLETILQGAGVTKGALYHHFANKKALAFAVIDEVYWPRMMALWMDPLDDADDPIEVMLARLAEVGQEPSGEVLRNGCPLNNLSQEMSSVDEEFRRKLSGYFEEWKMRIADTVRRAIEKGSIRPDVDPEMVALFVLGAVEGAVGLAKNARSDAPLRACCEGLEQYLSSLRNEAAVPAE